MPRNRRRTLLLAILLGATFAVTPAAAGHAGPAAPPPPTEQPDPASAASAAARAHQRVEVSSRRTETTQVFANPDGSFTAEQTAVPVRVRQANGTWVPVDLTLRRAADGSVSPVAAPVPTRLSGGGTGPLGTVTAGADRFALSWPGTLPAPVLSGDTATYADVVPGADLRVRVDRSGFSVVVVVRTRQAALSPALATVRLALAGTGAQFHVGAPMAWDSSRAPARAAAEDFGGSNAGERTLSTADGAGRAARRAPTGVRASGSELVVTPDAALLATGQLPLFVDPQVSVNRLSWTMINSTFPNQEYWDYDRASHAKVGFTNDPQNMVYRSLFQFDPAPWHGKHVLSATFSATLVHSWSCTNSTTELHLSSQTLSRSTTWNSNAGSWGGNLVGVSNQDCHDAAVYTEWGGAALNDVVQQSSAWTALTLGLRAQNEGSTSGWKKFDENTPKLSVTFNSPPNAPDQLTIDGKACGTGADKAWVSTLGGHSPVVRAHLSDADPADHLNVRFDWTTQTGSSSAGMDNVANGGYGQTAMPAADFAPGATYSFTATAGDYTDLSPTVGPCEFAVDNTAPAAAPVVSSADGRYPADGGVNGWHDGVGRSGTFTFDPAGVTDVVSYLYGLADPPSTVVGAPALGSPATVAVTPMSPGLNTLYVRSVDRAGNLSDITAYRFFVSSGTPPVGWWAFGEGAGATAADSGGSHPLTLTNASWTPGRPGSAVSFNGTSGYATTSGSVLRTDVGFTVSAWVNLTSGGAWHTAVSVDGNRASPFRLEYNPTGGQWSMSLPSADSDSPPAIARATATSPAQLGVWTHLAGVYDSGTHTAKLYVNGALVATVAVPAGTFNATGNLVVGRGKWAGAPTDWWAGGVDDVRVWDRVVGDAEVAAMAKPQLPVLGFPNGTSATVGRPVAVTFAGGGDADVVAYRYSMDGSTPTLVAKPNTPAAAVTVLVVPADDQAVLRVTAVDQAGNESPTYDSFDLDIAPPSGTPSRVRADLNNDGRADLPALYDAGNGRTQVWNASSSGSGLYPPTVAWDSTAFPMSRVKGASGDFDGDGKADVALFRDEGSARVTLTVLRSDGNGYATSPVVWDSGAGNWEWGRATLVAADFNGDGLTDLANLYRYDGAIWALWVWTSRGLVNGQIAFNAPANWYQNPAGWSDAINMKIAVADFNGDGRADVASIYNYPPAQTKLWIDYAQSNNTFTQAQLMWDSGAGNWDWARSSVRAGDVSGDGRPDVVIMYDYGNNVTKFWTFLGTGTGFALPAVWWDNQNPGYGWPWAASDTQYVLADRDGDGKLDVSVVYACCDGRLYTLRSTGTSFAQPSLDWQAPTGRLNPRALNPL